MKLWFSIWLICCSAMAQNVNVTNLPVASGFSPSDSLVGTTNGHAALYPASFFLSPSGGDGSAISNVVAAQLKNGVKLTNDIISGSLTVPAGATINIGQSQISEVAGEAINFFNADLGGTATISNGVFFGSGGVIAGPLQAAQITGNGYGVTNAQTIIGAQDQSANFNALNRFLSTCYNQARAIRLMSITDLTGYGDLGRFFYPAFGYAGELMSGGGFDGELEPDLSAGVTIAANNSPVWYAGLYSLHSGDTITWRKRNSSHGDTSIAGTNFFATKCMVLYVQETGAGTFKVQTNSAGGGWNDVTGGTVNANGTTNGASLTLSFTPGYYSVRVMGTAGTVRILDAGLWDDSRGMITSCGFNINNSPASAGLFSFSPPAAGSDASDRTSYTNIVWPWLQALAPDLIVITDTSGLGTTPESFPGEIGPWEFMITNALPNANQIWCANHFVTAADNSPLNKCIQTNAILYGVAFNDSYFDLGTNMAQLIADGIMNADGIHPIAGKGTDYLNGKLYRRVMQSAANLGFDWSDPTKFIYGNSVGLFNSGNTNPITLGAVPTAGIIPAVDSRGARLRVVDGYGNLYFGSLGSGAAGLWLGTSSSFDPGSVGLSPTNTVLYTDGTWIWFASPQFGATLGGIILGNPFPGMESGRLWARGGLSIGNSTDAGSGDPGAGSIRAQNSIKTVHYIAAGSAPTVTTNVACGGGSVATIDPNGRDAAFSVKLVTGAAPSTGQIFHFTFATGYGTAPHVVASSRSAAAGVLAGRFWTTNETTTGFDFYTSQSLTASTNYEWSYISIQ